MITKEMFIERSNKIHNNKYDYSLVEYKNTHKKVKIICPEHGIFEQTPHSHLHNGCVSCAGLKKLTTTEFIEKANKIHNNKYDYSLVEYINSSTKVKIICPEHDIFEQTPNNHINQKQGCPKCFGFNKTTEDFINQSNKIHNFKYNYDLTEYISAHKKIKIICPEHGIFELKPNTHLLGIGCSKCAGCNKKTTEEFINQSNKIHNFKYNYDLTEYVSAHKKIKIICSEHGIFNQTPNQHLRNRGCPNCKYEISKGESQITDYLKENNIYFIPQYKFDDCKYKNKLPFDFYLPNINICIEFDGEQHFKTSKAWGGDERLKLTQLRDKIKTDYCKYNNINLIRIRYNENIEEKLNQIINI